MNRANRQSGLFAQVRVVWRRQQLLRITEGAFAFLRWGLSMFVAGVFIDWLTKMPAGGRVVILLAIIGIALYKAWASGWKHIRPFDAARTALLIEKQNGGMESLLVSAVQLQGATSGTGTSSALCEVTCRKAEEAAGSLRAEKAVPFNPLRRPALMALAAILVLGVLSALRGPILLAGVGRIFAPWLAIEYPTRTGIELAQSDWVVQEGRPVVISARISKVVPRKAKIALRTGKGKPRLRTLPIRERRCEYRIETAFRGFEYRISAGDARTPWHTVEVIGAPNIERAEVKLEYPGYTGRAPENVEALTLTVPETTRIYWTLSLDRAVREAELNLAGQDPVPVDISPDGRTVQFEQVASESRAYGFSWVERDHGFSFTSPSYYLQVAPDRPPRVELTAPRRNLYATLGRKLDLAFRGRDDHGVAESFVLYRVDKIEQERVAFTPQAPVDGSEQVVDWDYRSALPDLTVGQTVSFAIELSDRYPGANGPHRVRSEFRRMQFMSREDYLAQVEKQKKRLLSQLRAVYREQREVHEVVMRLEPTDPVFVQSCQLEAVRQDLMSERLKKLAGRMLELTEDLAANSITDEPVIAALAELRTDLLDISESHVAKAADALRALAGGAGTENRGDLPGKDHAVYMVDSSARELGLLVLQLGYTDAAEVMAREMHAAAQTQAALRLRTIMPEGRDPEHTAKAQARLGKWLTRLFEASPKEKESTIEDALIEFTLTRIVKRMLNDGVDRRLSEAAALVADGKSADAAKLQAEVIAALLKGEFRLRVGAERESLAEAMSLFESQRDGQQELRLEIEALDERAFGNRRTELAEDQETLHKDLQLLLMPAIPARRVKLFDDAFPTAPPVNDLLAAADAAMTQAAAHIRKGEHDDAVKAQAGAESAFAKLADITAKRIAAMTQAIRIERLTYASQDIDETLSRFGERQLSLLEKTEDAAADGTESDYLAGQEEVLAKALDELRMELRDRIQASVVPSEHSLSLPARMANALQSMRRSVPLLEANKAAEAAKYQVAAVSAVDGAREILAEHLANIGPYAGMLAMTRAAVRPSPFVREIEEEQRDMLELTRKSKPDDMPKLALPQKNLIHAVDAVLVALDPIAHLVESGTVMLFAKDDMDSAGEALEIKDDVEALDAQDYIVETLSELRAKIEAVVPQYQYLLEVAEAIHENVQEGILIREAQRALREELSAGAKGAVTVSEAQRTLKARAETYGRLMNEITGLNLVADAAAHMLEIEKLLMGNDIPAAVEKMVEAENNLKSDTAALLLLMKHLSLVLAAPPPGSEIPGEIVLLRDVLATAARQKALYRESYPADETFLRSLDPELRELEEACARFVDRAKQHRRPLVEETGSARMGDQVDDGEVTTATPATLHSDLSAAKNYLAQAATDAWAADRKGALANQKRAAENLRHFIIEYTLIFVEPPAPPPPADPAPTDDFSESEDMMSLFMPGAVSGKRPPDGRLEWEVLGKRDRAALNENFARELPLEYRAILKDYYERLAR